MFYIVSVIVLSIVLAIEISIVVYQFYSWIKERKDEKNGKIPYLVVSYSYYNPDKKPHIVVPYFSETPEGEEKNDKV